MRKNGSDVTIHWVDNITTALDGLKNDVKRLVIAGEQRQHLQVMDADPGGTGGRVPPVRR